MIFIYIYMIYIYMINVYIFNHMMTFSESAYIFNLSQSSHEIDEIHHLLVTQRDVFLVNRHVPQVEQQPQQQVVPALF